MRQYYSFIYSNSVLHRRKKFPLNIQNQLHASKTLDLSKFLAVHSLWATVHGLTLFYTGVGPTLHAKYSKGIRKVQYMIDDKFLIHSQQQYSRINTRHDDVRSLAHLQCIQFL